MRSFEDNECNLEGGLIISFQLIHQLVSPELPVQLCLVQANHYGHRCRNSDSESDLKSALNSVRSQLVNKK